MNSRSAVFSLKSDSAFNRGRDLKLERQSVIPPTLAKVVTRPERRCRCGKRATTQWAVTDMKSISHELRSKRVSERASKASSVEQANA